MSDYAKDRVPIDTYTCIQCEMPLCLLEPMHDNGTQTIKAEVVEPIVEAQETCREEANTSSSYSPSPRTVYTCNDGKVSRTGPKSSPAL